MSMIGCFYALKDEDLESIIKAPKQILALWSEPKPPEKPIAFDVDKAWHGIHFLLTGSDWEGEGPLAFILHGGREIDEDLGYGPPHGFTSTEVGIIDSALQGVDGTVLYERADLEEFTKNDIYPQVWAHEPKEDCMGYVIDHFNNLKKFVNDTAKAKKAMIAYLG